MTMEGISDSWYICDEEEDRPVESKVDEDTLVAEQAKKLTQEVEEKDDEDIRDLRINDVLGDLKSKKLNLNEISGNSKSSELIRLAQERSKSSVSLRKIYSEKQKLDMMLLNERKCEQEKAQNDFYKEERLRYNEVPKVNLNEMLAANQSDIQTMLSFAKQKNKSFLESIID